MVYFPGMQAEARSVKPGQLLEMFDSSWRVRNIWDGVRLEVVEDRSPVVLHSFTHLDPDLPLVEVRRVRRRVRRQGEEARRGPLADAVCCVVMKEGDRADPNRFSGFRVAILEE